MNILKYFAALALLGLAATAMAQAPAAPAAEAAMPVAPKASCGSPENHPGKQASEMRRKTWQRDVATWQDCMKKYIDTTKSQGDVYFKAANDAVEEFNKATNMWNEQIKAIQ